MLELILENFKLYFSTQYEKMVSYEYEENSLEIIVTLEDGSRWHYDDIDNTIRKITDKNNLQEEDYDIEFGSRVQHMMRRKGISQLELCELTGIGQAQMSRYITGKNRPNGFKIRQIARALGCSSDYLMYM